MPRRVFYSFHYLPDCSRVSQVRNIGAIEENKAAHDNDWDRIKQGGDSAVQRWIDGQLHGRSATVVLIGSGTAGRKWIKYEIKKSWEDGKGLVGVYIHNLKNLAGQQAYRGRNPFEDFNIDGTSLATLVKTYDPPFSDSKLVYSHIALNLAGWIDKACAARSQV